MTISEQFILLQAPNAAAAFNGRKLSENGSFRNHSCNDQSNIYWAECAGSGSNPYKTSIDFSVSEEAPTYRCSCPSRQFPCKHALGLLYEIMADRLFHVSEIPADLAEKKLKQAARAAKKEETKSEPAAKKGSQATQKKKIAKQLEGLDLAQKMVDDLLRGGVGSLGGTSAQSFEKIAKDLGNFYLTGPQIGFTRMALAVRKIQQQPDNAGELYAEALRILISLHATIKKARVFLTQKLETENYSGEDSILYEALGGIWRLEDLKAIGSVRKYVYLIQLSFDVSYDEAKKEYVERGFWMDMEDGTVFQTLNFRPVKALKYVKADDSRFDVLEIVDLYVYPGELNKRVRWDRSVSRPITREEQNRLPALAVHPLAEIIKAAKGQMKNTLMPKYIPALIPIGAVGYVGEELVLEDPAGSRVILRDRQEEGEDHRCIHRLKDLPVRLSAGSALFGLVYYDAADRRICVHPYSVLTPDAIIRLLY